MRKHLAVPLVSFMQLITAPGTMAQSQADQSTPFEKNFGEQRLEQRTPPGPVEPPRLRSPGAGIPAENGYARPQRPITASGPRSYDLTAFRVAYASAGSPRLAVYFNRELSDEVREWLPSDRTVNQLHDSGSLSASGVAKTSGSSTHSVNVQAKAERLMESTSTRQQYLGPSGPRDDPAERWKWQFEDAVTATFLDGRAKLVDRAVIFRATAKAQPQAAGFAGSTSTTLNESAALEKYADVLIEILVAESSDSPTGYDFRATAKSLKDGRLIGTAFVDGYDNPNPVTQRYVAGNGGYQLESRQVPASVADVSTALSHKLMDSMAIGWAR